MMIISSQKQRADIEKYGKIEEYKDFRLIMSDYRSGNKELQDKAKEDACKNLERFVSYLITKYYPTYTGDFTDLMQQGYLGIIKALDKYDPTLSMPTTYFKTYIRSEISAYITRYKNSTTPYYASLIKRIDNVIHYYKAHGMECTAETIAAFFAEKTDDPVSVSVIEDILNERKNKNTISLSEVTEKGIPVTTSVGSTGSVANPEETYIKKEEELTVAQILTGTLDKDELFTIVHRYGFGEKMTFPKIAEALGVDCNKARTIHNRAVRKLSKNRQAANLLKNYKIKETDIDG